MGERVLPFFSSSSIFSMISGSPVEKKEEGKKKEGKMKNPSHFSFLSSPSSLNLVEQSRLKEMEKKKKGKGEEKGEALRQVLASLFPYFYCLPRPASASPPVPDE